MRFLVSSISFLALLTPAISSNPTAVEATKFSLIYGYPLLPFTQWAVPIVSSHYGTNSFKHNRQLSTAADQAVVRPNVDTLYSQAILDLSANDLVIEIPLITHRYWVFPFYDAYGNNYANLGSSHHNIPGRYRIRFANSATEKPGVYLCNQGAKNNSLSNDTCAGYRGFINSPTPYGGIVGRILVKDNGSDIQHVYAIQNQTTLYPVTRWNPDHSFKVPKLTTEFLNGSLSSDIPTRIMQLTARIAPFNPARNFTDQPRVQRMLREAGIHKGQYTPTVGNLTLLAQKALADVKANAAQPGHMGNLKNNWHALNPSDQGDYNMDYKMRSFVASTGYLALVATEVLYPFYGDGSNFSMEPKQAYIITFNNKPPQTEFGFWSLTAYNARQFLVPNPLNRYAVGDRSNLTYADGSLVYGSGSKNESFQILVQSANIPPPQNWTAK
ncbi:uncharacterized protein ATNIH1004_008011 [Aspergillus tanneri]|uniref:DUF1254 domain-containing protein n=1 Tax=Aspergillus tanneri TaxID=1220188 RepID=A0A5M9MHY2_9EURO|nr:uncharacterized protein ATNIH1004_008011 [Aspergillus tanneri]KAA8646578.1 hypothetical protein ATNIH1004_008011 [Aspergillus tanneri]